jgi:hypothetical protein
MQKTGAEADCNSVALYPPLIWSVRDIAHLSSVHLALQMTDNYSVSVDLTGNHFQICRSAAFRASSSRTGSEDNLVAVVFGAAAIEAYIDHIRTFGQVRYPYSPEEEAKVNALAEALETLEKYNAQWLLKLQLVSLILSDSKLDRSRSIWQDIEFLFKMRNCIIHPSLSWNVQEHVSTEPSYDKITRGCLDRGLISQPRPIKGLPGSVHEYSDLVPPPTDWLFAPKVAEWSVSTAETGIRGIIDLATPILKPRLLEMAERSIFRQVTSP